MAGEADLCCGNICVIPFGIVVLSTIVYAILKFINISSDLALIIAIIIMIIFGLLAYIGRWGEYFKQYKK